ncbi:MAG: protein-disulfide reductase DsbD [Gammaproteobacteria bacterium]|nr:protein-disulfide reductase DsbD [Gammaproteobacteria bacterium]MCH9764320.1 protein-disulfide reductase DsbD [Gammaproteobacteria bacterium]
MKRILFFLSISLLLTIATPGFSEPPSAESVFKLKAVMHDPNTFFLEWQIKPGYFLYRDRLHLADSKAQFSELAPLKLPQAKTKIDGLGQTVSIYRNKLRIPVGIVGLSPGEDILNLRYQGCSDDGFCYPPEFASIKLTIDTQLALTKVILIPPTPIKNISSTATPAAPPTLNTINIINTHFAGHHWLITLLIFGGLGILLSLTPCVLPMIPVLSGILVGHGKNLSTKKAFFLSLTYVLSMSLTYAAIGAIVAILGENLQVLLQSPLAITSFSIIFVILALAMFDVYELKLPTSWQAKLSSMSYKQSSGHYLGVAIMGCLSTLILSPCVTAPLIGALGFIAQTGNVLLGSAALFFLGLGMGLPLLLIGASLGRWLPHAGHWMNTIKHIFGLMLLAIAIYLMNRLLPPFISMLLWAGLLIFSGLILGAFKKASSNLMRFVRGLGILLLSYGLLILIGAGLGNTNPLKPLMQTKKHHPSSTLTVTNMKQLEAILQEAIEKKQPVLLDFYADWCTSCKVIESTTLNNPDILNALTHIKLIKVDVTASNHESRALLHEFDVIAPPTFVFIGASGHENEALRLVGNISVSNVLTNLKSL